MADFVAEVGERKGAKRRFLKPWLHHTVRLMPPAYVRPYVKNDATDAEAICEAVPRPSMRFVETKTTGLSAGDFLQKTRPGLSCGRRDDWAADSGKASPHRRDDREA